MKPEPQIPRDGRCVICKKPLPAIERYGAGHDDAFCSTVCCREYFGTKTAIDVALTEK